MPQLRATILIIIAILIIVNGWLSLTWISLQRTVFSDSYYQHVLSDTDVILPVHLALRKNLPELVETILAREMLTEVDNTAMPDIGDRQLQAELVSQALIRTFDHPWMNEQIQVIIEDVLATLSNKNSALETNIDLRAKKEELHREIVIAMEVLPEENLNDLGIGTDQISVRADLFMEALNIPDFYKPETSLVFLGLSEEISDIFKAYNALYRLIQYWPLLIFLALFALKILITGTAVGLRWIGTATLFFSLSFYTALQFIRAALLIKLPGVTTLTILEETTYSPAMINDIVNFTFSRTGAAPLQVAGIGLLLLGTGIIVARRGKS